MPGPFSRRRPWPFDCELDIGDGTGWHGLMLKPTQAGLLVGRLSEFLGEVAPTSYEYGAARPDEETTFVFGRLVGGMGEQIQSSPTSKRYRYASGVDCSIGGMPRLGPLFAAATFPAVLGSDPSVRQFIVGPGESGGVGTATPRALYCLRGRAVYRLEAGTWVLSHDVGGVDKPMQAVVFQGTSGPARLIVTTALGEVWGYDGTNPWENWDDTTGAGGGWHCAVVGDELYIGAGNTVRLTRGDPIATDAFGGAIRVGHAGTRITYLAALADTLFIFKADGVYTLNADGSDNDLFPELRPQQTGPGGFIPEFAPPGYAVNGLNATAWRDALYFPYGNAYYRVTPQATLEPIGPERLVENTSPVRGVPVAGSGHADWFLYTGTWSAPTGSSFLWKYGTWTPAEAATAPAGYHFDEVWNGALVSWSKQITRVDVINLDGDATLWVGFVDGTVESTALPARTPDPGLDPRCRFVAAGRLYWPLHDAVFGADRKAWHGVTVLGPVLNAGQSARQYWRTDPAAAYVALVPDFTANGQRLEFPDLTTGAARDAATGLQLDTYTELRTTDATLTPVLEGVALHEAVRPAAGDPTMRLSWTMTAVSGNRVVRRDGVVSRATAEATRVLLRKAAAAAGHVLVRLPDEVVGGFAVISYDEALHPDSGRDGLEEDIPLRLIQYR
jgi:hypothetical protein